MRVLFWVQHLLGIGHLRRAAVLAVALAEAGFDVLLVSGGPPVRNLGVGRARLAQLPAVRAADSRFSALVDEAGGPFEGRLVEARRRRLLRLFQDHRPHVLVIEMFPFGRRAFRGELAALLEAARLASPRPGVFCSVRDVLTAKSKPGRHEEMAEAACRWFDGVLVHGDPALIPFDASFPEVRRIDGLLRYTGYVAPSRPLAAPLPLDGEGGVVVSAGGGAAGARLLEAALAARPLTMLAARPWRILAGDDPGEDWLERLRANAGPGVTVERNRPDFPALLEGAALSISQAGYNTAVDLMRARPPALLVPFGDARETEQIMRARALAARGAARLLMPDVLSPGSLAAAADEAALAGRPAALGVRLDGAADTARILRSALDP